MTVHKGKTPGCEQRTCMKKTARVTGNVAIMTVINNVEVPRRGTASKRPPSGTPGSGVFGATWWPAVAQEQAPPPLMIKQERDDVT